MKCNLRKLSELALLLNFILAKAFFVKGFDSKLRTSISLFSESLYIKGNETHAIIEKIEGAFNELHEHQFIMYKFEVMISSNPKIDISIMNRNRIEKKAIKKMLKENAKILTSLGYEATLEEIT